VSRYRVIVFVFAFFLLNLSFGFSTSAQTTDLTVTFTQNANMRSGPDTTNDIVKIIPAGQQIRLDGRTDTGNWIRGITTDGLIGWVSSGTVDLTLGQLSGLRIITEGTPFSLEAPSPAQPAVTTSGSGGTGLSVSAVDRVNMRSGPDTSYRRVDGLEINETFNVDGRDSSSNWVRGINARGQVGWVAVPYLAITVEELTALPVVSVDSNFDLSAPAGSAVPSTSAAPEAAPAAPVVTTSAVRGFNLGGHVEALSEHAANWMRVAGMTWIKRQHRYHDGQNPNELAGLINETHARGFRLLLGVVGNKAQLNNPGYYDRYAAFVAGLAALGIDAVEVWNEPNIEHEWPAGQINPAQNTQLLRTAYIAAKNANPNTMIVSAAPAPTGFFGGCSGAGCDDNAFISGMAAAGAANYMDCIGIHYNEGILPPGATSGDPRGNSGHYTRYFGSMMNVYSAAFGGARPLCFTEMGYLSPEGYGPLSPHFAWASEVSVAEQAAWLDQAVNIARNSGRVRLLIVWNVDFTHYGADPMAGYAIIRPGGGCPACEALAR
jgi:uncharacterized protein YraI